MQELTTLAALAAFIYALHWLFEIRPRRNAELRPSKEMQKWANSAYRPDEHQLEIGLTSGGIITGDTDRFPINYGDKGVLLQNASYSDEPPKSHSTWIAPHMIRYIAIRERGNPTPEP